jgi:hypothetical protein
MKRNQAAFVEKIIAIGAAQENGGNSRLLEGAVKFFTVSTSASKRTILA